MSLKTAPAPSMSQSLDISYYYWGRQTGLIDDEEDELILVLNDAIIGKLVLPKKIGLKGQCLHYIAIISLTTT